MLNNTQQIWLIVLGAFLALVTSFVVELYKDWCKRRDLNKNARVILRLELNNMIGLVKNLIENYTEKRYFEFRILNQLYVSLTRLEHMRNQVIYFTSDQKKELLLRFINDLIVFQADANFLEQWAWLKKEGEVQGKVEQNWDSDLFKDQRQMIALRSVDIIRRGEEIMNFLSS